MITEPGVYDITDAEYFADPVEGGSLSSTGARRLLPPSCPAKFRYVADNPPLTTAAFDMGHAAHRLVLGVGPELRLIDHEKWNTNVAKQAVAEAREAGAVPLKLPEYDQVHAMAAAIRAHPIASVLFRPDSGRAEQTLMWRDHRTGASRRARLDWLPHTPANGGRMVLPDYKTCVSSEPSEVERAIHKHGYHQQGDWYLDGVYALNLAQSAAFALVCQEKTAPYVVTVVQIHPDTLLAGHVLNEYAIDVYRECVNAGHWPGYSEDVVLGRLPGWAEIQFERARERGDYAVKEKVR